MTFHPFSEVYPLMPAEDLNRLTNSMRAIGYDARFPIVKFGGQILDGRNRWKAAELAHVNPTFIDFAGSDEEAHQFVITANEERRHLTPQWLEQHRRERIDRVVELRKEGKSERAIAEIVGVSPKTVHKDLEKAVATGVATEPESGTITTKDGKTRPAKNKPGLCERCTRVGSPACSKCLARAAKAKPKTTQEKLAAAADEATPEEEQTVEEQIKEKNAELEAWCRDLMTFASTMPDDPWLQDMNRRDGAMQKIKGVCETIRSAKCVCACPKCEGQGCRHCHNSGRLTKYAKDQLG